MDIKPTQATGWDDAPCGRRVGKLYLPPGKDYFRCRVCHNLTYSSVKEHDKRVDALHREQPLPLILDQLEHGPSWEAPLLVLKALARLVEKERRKASAG